MPARSKGCCNIRARQNNVKNRSRNQRFECRKKSKDVEKIQHSRTTIGFARCHFATTKHYRNMILDFVAIMPENFQYIKCFYAKFPQKVLLNGCFFVAFHHVEQHRYILRARLRVRCKSLFKLESFIRTIFHELGTAFALCLPCRQRVGPARRGVPVGQPRFGQVDPMAGTPHRRRG